MARPGRSAGPRKSPSTLKDPGDAEAAFEAAVVRLARQPQPRAALLRRLLDLGYLPEAAAVALERAQRLGYLDDEAYAQALVRRRSRSRGAPLIARELRAKGIPPASADRALAELSAADQWEQARRLAMALVRRRPPLDREELRRRVGGSLGRRGFSPPVINRICEELSAELPARRRFDTLGEVD